MSTPKIKRWEKPLKKLIFQKNFLKNLTMGNEILDSRGRVIINILFILIKKKVGTAIGSQNARNSFSVG